MREHPSPDRAQVPPEPEPQLQPEPQPAPEATAPTPHIAASLPRTNTTAASPRSVLLPAETVPEFSVAAPPPCCAFRTAPEFPPAASNPAAWTPPTSGYRPQPVPQRLS